MSNDSMSAHEDLAFMRNLVEGDGNASQATAGKVFLVCGLIYGAQCLAEWAGLAGFVPVKAVLNVWVGFGPTVLCVAAIAIINLMARKQTKTSTQRAMNAVFASMGFANLAMVAVFGLVAYQRRDWTIWELYACVVFAFQGAAWLASFALRKRAWHLLISLCWFATAITLSLILGSAEYILIAGVAMILFMALPGLITLRAATRQG